MGEAKHRRRTKQKRWRDNPWRCDGDIDLHDLWDRLPSWVNQEEMARLEDEDPATFWKRLRALGGKTEREPRVDHVRTATNMWNDQRAATYGGINCMPAYAWPAILDAFDHSCAYCGVTERRLTVDHVVPMRHGGDNAPWNVVPACWPCNMSKHASELAEWCSSKGRPLAEVEARIGFAMGKLDGAAFMRPSFGEVLH